MTASPLLLFPHTNDCFVLKSNTKIGLMTFDWITVRYCNGHKSRLSFKLSFDATSTRNKPN